jgi:hypothetical protein
MRVLGLVVAGTLALIAPIAGRSSVGIEHKAIRPCGGHRPSMGRLRLGLASGARPLEPVEGWMGSSALRA